MGKRNDYFFGLVVCLLFFSFLHLFFKSGYNDDSFFAGITTGFDTVWSWLAWRYATDSSRLISEGLLYFLLRLPFAVWCILDILFCLLIYHCLCVMLVNDHKSSGNLLLLGAYLSWPFMHMASAGWIATTTNYLWPFAAICYCMSIVIRRQRGEQPGVWQYLLSVPAALLAVNCELPAACLLLLALGAILIPRILKQRHGAYGFEYFLLLAACGGLLLAFSCPGNAMRSDMELQWMPEFPALSFFDKFRLCSVFVFEHFVSIPNVLFLLFALGLFFLGKRKLLSALPLLIDLVFTLYFFIRRFLLGGLRSYDFDFLPAQPQGAVLAGQYVELLALLVFIAAAVYAIASSQLPASRKLWCIWALGSGFAVREALMLSPTMFASWHRTLIFFYFAMIGASVCAFIPVREKLKRRLLIPLLSFGIFVNLILTIGHQLRR